MADKFGGQKDGRQTTGATFYDVPAVSVNANALYFPDFPASPFFGIAEYPVAAGDLGAFSTSGVFVFDKPVGWIDNPGRKVFYRPKTAATGEIVAQEIKGDVFVGYQIVDNINPQKLGVLLASPELCMNVLMVTSTADSGAGSLRQAIADASDGDVILFDPDVFPTGQTTSILLSSYIAVNKSVSIYGGFSDGNGGYTSGAAKRFYVYREIEGVKTKVYIDDDNPAQDGETVLFENVCRVALDGQEAVRCAYSSSNINIYFSGIEFKNGATANGGGVYFYNGGASFIDCNFNNCSGTTSAGAIRSDLSETMIIRNCSFVGCSSVNGGGIFATQNSQNTLSGCIFDGCSATTTGGGLYSASTSQNTLTDCTISGCSANYGGGIFATQNSQNTLNDCTITGCSATSGGGLYSASTSQNTLNDCNISGCSANNGGGIYSYGTSQNTLTDCIISGCSSDRNGGGVYTVQSSQNTLTSCTIIGNTATIVDRSDIVAGETSRLICNGSNIGHILMGVSSAIVCEGGITTVYSLTMNRNSSGGAATITIADGAALTITTSATIGAATFTSDGRGYLATAAGIDISAATLTNVVLCAYGAGLESFEISADGASWTAADLTTPILIETRDAGGDWQTLTGDATGGEYATTFALESTARAFDGVAFFVATLPGYWQAGDAGAVDANDWSVRGFAAANSNGGGDAQGDAAQGWTVTPSTVTPNADGV